MIVKINQCIIATGSPKGYRVSSLFLDKNQFGDTSVLSFAKLKTPNLFQFKARSASGEDGGVGVRIAKRTYSILKAE